MRILVTGAAGFVGRYMLRELRAAGHEPIGIGRHGPSFPVPVPDTAWHVCDVLDRPALERIVQHERPDGCIHLAGISFVPDGARHPETMLSVNTAGTLNLLEAFRAHAPAARILCVSTAHVYGAGTHGGTVREEAPLRPVSLYSISKAAADLAALGYAETWRLAVMTARPNNHTGPGQSDRFVIPGLLAQAGAIAAGTADPVIHAGNLESERDFTDVRDVARAYRLLIEHGRAGEAYNIGSGRCIPIGEVLRCICRLLDIQPEFRIDAQKFRPTDCSPRLDTSRIEAQTGWRPTRPLEQTLRDMIEAQGRKPQTP